jgi:hypothetical protein
VGLELQKVYGIIRKCPLVKPRWGQENTAGITVDVTAIICENRRWIKQEEDHIQSRTLKLDVLNLWIPQSVIFPSHLYRIDIIAISMV